MSGQGGSPGVPGASVSPLERHRAPVFSKLATTQSQGCPRSSGCGWRRVRRTGKVKGRGLPTARPTQLRTRPGPIARDRGGSDHTRPPALVSLWRDPAASPCGHWCLPLVTQHSPETPAAPGPRPGGPPAPARPGRRRSAGCSAQLCCSPEPAAGRPSGPTPWARGTPAKGGAVPGGPNERSRGRHAIGKQSATLTTRVSTSQVSGSPL